MPYTPPIGSVWAAFEDQDHIDHWLRLQPNEELRERNRVGLQAVRDRGVSLTLLSEAQREFVSTMDTMAKTPDGPGKPLRGILQSLSFDPPELTSETKDSVRQVSAPVFDREGRVAFVLTAFGFGRPISGLEGLTAGLLDVAAAATRRIGGHSPQRHQEAGDRS